MRAFTLRILMLVLFLFSASAFAGGKHLVTYTSKDDFDTVKNAITEAIAGKGLVINTISHIGEMLERTGRDMGGAKQVFVKAESIEFCSATVSRKTMEADPHNIVFCPYIISIYVLPNEPNKTYVSYRKPDLVGTPASKASLKEVEKLLRSIIEEALN
ncbi:MAG: DUF302 domain-containing protein [Betaproteobacteria bacterium RBG_16_58_11]|nr:MAG: DUF302 domain-containing protein [Betaproteobacteria bacterium RBG_16_58_11]